MGPYTRLVLIWPRGNSKRILRENDVVVLNWNLVLFTSNFPVGSLAINQNAKKDVLWPVQHLVFTADLDQRCKQNKNRLIEFKLFYCHIAHYIYVCVCFATNTTFNLSKQWDSIRDVFIHRRSRVYNHYTQDCPMGITEKILQYYNIVLSRYFSHCLKSYGKI